MANPCGIKAGWIFPTILALLHLRKIINKGWTWFSLLLMLHAVKITKSVDLHYNIIISCLIIFKRRKVAEGLLQNTKIKSNILSFGYLSSFVVSVLIFILGRFDSKLIGEENECSLCEYAAQNRECHGWIQISSLE